jgi:hypothetical protein
VSRARTFISTFLKEGFILRPEAHDQWDRYKRKEDTGPYKQTLSALRKLHRDISKRVGAPQKEDTNFIRIREPGWLWLGGDNRYQPGDIG